MVKKYEDLGDTSKTLKDEYENGDLAMVMNLNYKLSPLKFQKITFMEEFLRTT